MSSKKKFFKVQCHKTAKLIGWMPIKFRQLYPFPSQRFHALLNSLFKVLCNFPSRYLFAIGLVVIFSLRWGLPPSLGCNLKQPDSMEQPIKCFITRTGLAPSMDCSPAQGDFGCTKHFNSCTYTLQFLIAIIAKGFSAGLFPVHSPLLRKSSLVSFPPLSYMLKFSG